MKKLSFLLPSLILLTNGYKQLPSEPEVFYGGFVPLIAIPSDSVFSEDRLVQQFLPFRRNSKHISFNNPHIHNILPKHKPRSRSEMFRFNDSGAFGRKHNVFVNNHKKMPFHKDKGPTFPLRKFHCLYFFHLYFVLFCWSIKVCLFQIFLRSTDLPFRMPSLGNQP